MDSIDYLGRIGFRPIPKPKPTKQLLDQLHRQHLFMVPFENLDIHYHVPIVLDLERIYHKVVERDRGGFCYELNGLFYALLKDLGFKVRMVSGRVHQGDGAYGPEYDHMALVVQVEKKSYLVDVGFGKFTMDPLEIVTDQRQLNAAGTFYLDRLDANYWRVHMLEKIDFVPQYVFSLQERKLEEFQGMCDHHQKSPESPFTRSKVISKAMTYGRLTLTDHALKITEGDVTTEHPFAPSKFEFHLRDRFNIYRGRNLGA